MTKEHIEIAARKLCEIRRGKIDKNFISDDVLISELNSYASEIVRHLQIQEAIDYALMTTVLKVSVEGGRHIAREIQDAPTEPDSCTKEDINRAVKNVKNSESAINDLLAEYARAAFIYSIDHDANSYAYMNRLEGNLRDAGFIFKKSHSST